MAFRPSMAKLLAGTRFDRDDRLVREAHAVVREMRLKRERAAKRLYEDRSGGYMGSDSHVTGRNLDGPMG